jgi:hypothetical protein
MGRLPGGIVDETRDYIIKEVDTLNRSKLLKFSASSSAQRKASQSQGHGRGRWGEDSKCKGGQQE